jgi:preprotein translocase subunit SecF
MVNFLKYRWLYFLISSVIILSGLFSIVRWGYQFSIEFTGGTNLIYRLEKKVDKDIVENILKEKKIFLKTRSLEKSQEDDLKKALEKRIKSRVIVEKLETVGPTLGKEMVKKTIIASTLAIFGILVYMSFAFHGFKYALSAILAMIHDFTVLMGSYSLLCHYFGAEFDTMFVTAVLTTMSFSVHDTIVIFDKIREYFQEEGKKNLEYFANKALTETMVRSINNSMTIIFMLLSLSLLGGSTIRFFVIALLIGTVIGTYSSPFVATPILVWLYGRNGKR